MLQLISEVSVCLITLLPIAAFFLLLYIVFQIAKKALKGGKK
jgi:hypothetical protein